MGAVLTNVRIFAHLHVIVLEKTVEFIIIRASLYNIPLVWEYCTSRSCVEWPQWYCQVASELILFCWQHQQFWVYPSPLGQPKWPRQGGENSAEMASRSITTESGRKLHENRWIVKLQCIEEVLHSLFFSMVRLLFTWLPSTITPLSYLCLPLSKSIWMLGERYIY